MRVIGSVILALLLGLILGGWGPRREVEAARREIEELKAQLRKGGGRTAGLENITTLLRVPDRAPSSERRRPSSAGGEPPSNPAATGTNATPGRGPGGRGDGTNRMSRADFRERIQAAAEAWKVRRDIARKGFANRLKMNPDQTVQVDVIMQAMNVRLEESVARWVEYIKEAEAMSPEDGVRMMNELSAIIVTTYDDLDRALPEEWRDQAGENFQVFDFINPEVALPLAEVEGIVDRPGRGFPPPPPPGVESPKGAP